MNPLQIEVVSDVVCPWCFIGKRHLDASLDIWRRDHPERPVTVTWRPYFLNPDTPAAGEPYRPFLEQKFGSAAEVDALLARVANAGEKAGVRFAFDRISLRVNTLLAHRLIHHVQKVGADGTARDQLVEQLFAANFQAGENLGDVGVVTHIAGECGLDATLIHAYLLSADGVDEVRDLVEEAQQMGVNSVPCFIFNRRFAVNGAQPPEQLLQALEHASSCAA